MAGQIKIFLLIVLVGFSVMELFSQPVNDDCNGLIDLGVVPACPDLIFYNIDATASDIGFGNIPICFEGGAVQNDVWFTFVTSSTLVDLTITVQGTDMGDNSPLINPQINLYRGDCSFNGLADLGICDSAPDGESTAQIDALGLSPNTAYFIRVNDHSPTATPNWGDFLLCVEEYIPSINIGDSPSSTSCLGTFYDSGGPEADYQNNENLFFIIQPEDFFVCLEIELIDLQLEEGFDFLNFYAGTGISEALIASFTGAIVDDTLIIQSNGPITVEFISDGSTVQPGFKFTWQCYDQPCSGSSVDNPTPISGLPFDQDGFTTCGAAATFAESPCGILPFMSGPEYVFTYESAGGNCADVIISGAEPGTGVLVLDGPPDDESTVCIGQSEEGVLYGVDFISAGTYYIIVANAESCTGFDLSISSSTCRQNPSLISALCNPINKCSDSVDIPSVLYFNPGSEDIAIDTALNNGCWLGTGSASPNYYWFTIETQSSGTFGFTAQAYYPDEVTDFDFNVWGPFTEQEVCDNPAGVIDYIENNQPVRSSFAGGADPTGLASTHPITGIPVTDEFDCGGMGMPGAGGDDFAALIDCEAGEVYAILLNDWGNNVVSGAIQMDWETSTDSVLDYLPSFLSQDTAVCQGGSLEITIDSLAGSVNWLNDTASLSCVNCLNPIATPTESTLYLGTTNSVCYQDTIEVMVEVLEINIGSDLTVCLNEVVQLEIEEEYDDTQYSWNVPEEVEISCDNCTSPVLSTEIEGDYEIVATLEYAGCQISDTMILHVTPEGISGIDASFSLAGDFCTNDTILINYTGDILQSATYSWGFDGATVISGTAQGPYEVQWPVPGEYNVSLQVSEENGCLSAPFGQEIEIISTPTANFMVSESTICAGSTIDINYTGNAEANDDYIWDFGNLTILTGSGAGPYEVFWENTGTDLISLTVNANGCVSETIDMPVNILANEPVFTILSDVTCILAEVGQQTDTLSTTQGCDSIVIREYTFPPALITQLPDTTSCYPEELGMDTTFLTTPGGCDSLLVQAWLPAPPQEGVLDTIICSGQSLLFADQLIDSSGIYSDTLTAFNGCDSILILNLEVKSDEPLNLSEYICPGEIYEFGNDLIMGPGQYTEIFVGENGCDSTVILNLEAADLEEYGTLNDEYVIEQGDNGARFSLIENDNLPPEYTLQLSVQPQYGNASLSNEGELEYILTDPGFLGIDSFAYKLCTSVCIDTCWISAILISTLRDCITEIVANLPTGFTPDGDGINDLFDPLGDVGITCLQNPQNAQLSIINVWGEVIHQRDNYQAWDGRVNGQLVPQGTYYFVLSFEVDGEEVILRETVHVLR